MWRTLNDFTRIGNKTGGAQSPGKHGGVYTGTGGDTYLIKREEQNQHNIAEFLASRVFAETAPGYGAEVHLVIANNDAQRDEIGTSVYLASKFFPGYRDLYVDIHELMGKPAPKDRPKLVGDLLHRGFEKGGYEGFSKTMVTSLLIGDRDTHWGNLGVVNGSSKKSLRRIDFGWAFSDLTKPLDPERIYLPGMGPTNHFREYPPELKFNPDFTAELRRVAEVDLTKCFEESVGELERYYGEKPLKEFAKYIGLKDSELAGHSVGDAIRKRLQTAFKERQKELERIACEIDLGLCIDKTSRTLDAVKLKEFVSKNLEFCKNFAEGKKDSLVRVEKSFFREVLEWIGVYKDLHKVIAQKLKVEITNELKARGIAVRTDSVSRKSLGKLAVGRANPPDRPRGIIY